MTWSLHDTIKQGPRPGGPPTQEAVPAPAMLAPAWTGEALPTMGVGAMATTMAEDDESPPRWPMEMRTAMEGMGMCPDDVWQALGTLMRRGVVEI